MNKKLISGVKITPLKQIIDERGKVMLMMRNDDAYFKKFGEIYFSCTHPGVVKAWHMHKKMTLNYAIISGQLKIVLFDDRKKSSTKGAIQEIYMSTENYFLLSVPPLVWNGFKGIGTETSIVANCSDIPHDPGEMIRISPNSKKIPYKWELKHR
jgi:dTDP-4-dehydrorhamnose 3,5-epimerase